MLGTFLQQFRGVGARAVQVVSHAKDLAVDHHFQGRTLLDNFSCLQGLNVGFKSNHAQVLLNAAAGGQSDVPHLNGHVAHEAHLRPKSAEGDFGDAEPAFGVGDASGDDLVFIKGQDGNGGKFNGGSRVSVLDAAKDHADFRPISHVGSGA